MVPVLRIITISYCLHIVFSEIASDFRHQPVGRGAKAPAIRRNPRPFWHRFSQARDGVMLTVQPLFSGDRYEFRR
jgi:hypothetical protein